MNSSPSSLYHREIDDLENILLQTICSGLDQGSGKAKVFFRADDIGVPSAMFIEMVDLFKKYQMPLCLAVVPGWITAPRITSLKKITEESPLFCWHQHGWIHKNHETLGKKQEFGESRNDEELRHDLQRGKKKLSHLLGNDFCRVFTPPWNRCGQTTLDLLSELGFEAISRSSGASPEVSIGFTDFQVNVDLHTRKEEEPQLCLDELLGELRLALAQGNVGIMLHHQRMNNRALTFLENLLQQLAGSADITPVHFQEMLDGQKR